MAAGEGLVLGTYALPEPGPDGGEAARDVSGVNAVTSGRTWVGVIAAAAGVGTGAGVLCEVRSE